MHAKYIPYPDTQAFSPVVLDYLSSKPELDPFYAYPATLEGLGKAITNRKFKGDRAVLVEALKAQYANIEHPALVDANIDLLADEHTFTITTGHQLNLFTGPLYFIYKIVTAINLARELKQKYPAHNFVPVYWMASEDHDFEEINHLKVEDKMLSWQKEAKGATGKLDVSDIRQVLIAYTGYLGISENGLRLSELVEKAYGTAENLADAMRILVDALFGKYGLVCIDADRPAFKKQFSDIVQQDIIEENSYQHISKENSALEKLGYQPQVNPRAINFFYMMPGIRSRLVKEGEHYKVLQTDISFNEDALKQEISAHPERFSPNVVMRPLYQEVILPNIAYIGGGAELTYWLQLKSNFEHYGVDYPVILLRNSALVIDKISASRMHGLGIDAKTIFKSTEALKNQWIKQHVSQGLALTDEERAISSLFEQIKLSVYKIDKTLYDSADSAKKRTLKMIHALEKKMIRAEKRKHGTSLSQIENLKEKVFPGGVLQERVVNIAPMYVSHGEEFIDSLLASFRPLDFQFTILFC